MKTIASLFYLCFVVACCFAQSPPTFTSDQKVAVLEAQHKLDAVEKQQKDLGLQIQDLQTKIQNESQRLAKSYADAKAAVDKAEAAAIVGVDEKKWKPDWETLTFSAVPAPAAPPNASNPPKPVPGSSGAAAPLPATQQAKK